MVKSQKRKGERSLNNEVGSGCMHCRSADGKLYEWVEVSIDADEVVWLCLPCFQHALDRQRLAVKENADVLQSASGSPAEHKELEVNWWMIAGGAVVVVAMIVFFVVQMFETFETLQVPTGGPYSPGYGPPPNSSPYSP